MHCDAGRISGHVLGVYIRSMGGYFRFSVLMFMFALVEAGRVCATVWLSTWTDTADNPAGAPHPAIWYLAIYAAISGIQARPESGYGASDIRFVTCIPPSGTWPSTRPSLASRRGQRQVVVL